LYPDREEATLNVRTALALAWPYLHATQDLRQRWCALE
jgi:hypothetical protein